MDDVVVLGSSLVGSGVSWLSRQVATRVPVADLDNRDPDYIRDKLPVAWLLASLWFRADVRGLDRVPDGPVLLVGNHSGGNVTPDTTILALAFNSYYGVERPFFALAHNLVVSHPAAGFLRKFGVIAANPENARAALGSGAALLVYPGGDYEVFRPSWDSGVVDFDGRKGFATLAREMDVPIVPVASVGGQETALFLSRGEWLAKLLKLDKALRLKAVSISLAVPWGLNIGDFGLHLPLPAKITIELLEPIVTDGFAEGSAGDEVLATVVLGRLQQALTRLSAERRFPVIG